MMQHLLMRQLADAQHFAADLNARWARAYNLMSELERLRASAQGDDESETDDIKPEDAQASKQGDEAGKGDIKPADPEKAMLAVTTEDEIDAAEKGLRFTLRELYERLRFAMEILSAPETKRALEADFAAYTESDANLGFGFDDDGDPRCEALDALSRYVSMLDSMFPAPIAKKDDADWRVTLLEQLLRHTPKILHDRNIKPGKEAPVYKAVGDVLSLVFPDFTPSVNLPKPLKTYKPDFGIP